MLKKTIVDGIEGVFFPMEEFSEFKETILSQRELIRKLEKERL